jgi:hypothetical protein
MCWLFHLKGVDKGPFVLGDNALDRLLDLLVRRPTGNRDAFEDGKPQATEAVAYPRPADKYLGPLVSRLSGVNQPVISTRNVFSTPRLTPLACV